MEPEADPQVSEAERAYRRRATETRLGIMRALSDGRSPFSGATGRSEHGGRASSLYSMLARGWVQLVGGEWLLTPQGLQVLRERG